MADSDPFLGLLLTVLGSQSDFHSSITPRCAYMSVMNIGCFGRFWPVSWTITQCFGVQEWFPWLPNPRVRLRVGRKHSLFWPILACFMDYYLLFWGPEVISMLVEHHGAFMCRSSTLTVLADSARFMDYYSLFWGPGVISMINKPWGAFTCRSSIINARSFGRS